METMVSAEYTNPSKLQDRFRDAEETRPSPSRRLSDGPGLTLRRFPAGDPRSEALSTPPHNEIGTPTTPSSSGPPSSRKPGSSGGRIGKVRQPIPLEFQNGSSGLVSKQNESMTDATVYAAKDRPRCASADVAGAGARADPLRRV
jgi:hypothetical protein